LTRSRWSQAPRRPRPCLDPLREHLDHGVEVRAGEVGEGRGLAREREELVLAPGLARAGGDDVLGQDIEGRHRRQDAVEPARAHAAQERRALDQLVARGRVEAALRRGTPRVARAPDPLQERREAPGRADLADELDGTDVDAQLERGRRHEDLQVPRPEPRLQLEPPVLREAAVMRRHAVLAHALGEQMGEPLGEPARVDEDQRGAM
jgi:hypothetical protein